MEKAIRRQGGESFGFRAKITQKLGDRASLRGITRKTLPIPRQRGGGGFLSQMMRVPPTLRKRRRQRFITAETAKNAQTMTN